MVYGMVWYGLDLGLGWAKQTKPPNLSLVESGLLTRPDLANSRPDLANDDECLIIFVP